MVLFGGHDIHAPNSTPGRLFSHSKHAQMASEFKLRLKKRNELVHGNMQKCHRNFNYGLKKNELVHANMQKCHRNFNYDLKKMNWYMVTCKTVIGNLITI